MPVRLVATGYGRPALEALGRAVAEAKATDPMSPVTILVPNNLAGIVARRFLAHGSAALLGLTGTGALANDGQGKADTSTNRNLINDAAQRCIDQGLEYLARAKHDDGSFGDRHQYRGNVAVTSLAALAFNGRMRLFASLDGCGGQGARVSGAGFSAAEHVSL